jgi:hypothetical protein
MDKKKKKKKNKKKKFVIKKKRKKKGYNDKIVNVYVSGNGIGKNKLD